MEEMRAVLQQRRDDCARVARLGAAAFDDMSMDDFLSFDLGRTLAIVDYYNQVYLPALAAPKNSA